MPLPPSPPAKRVPLPSAHRQTGTRRLVRELAGYSSTHGTVFVRFEYVNEKSDKFYEVHVWKEYDRSLTEPLWYTASRYGRRGTDGRWTKTKPARQETIRRLLQSKLNKGYHIVAQPKPEDIDPQSQTGPKEKARELLLTRRVLRLKRQQTRRRRK